MENTIVDASQLITIIIPFFGTTCSNLLSREPTMHQSKSQLENQSGRSICPQRLNHRPSLFSRPALIKDR